MTAPIRIPVDLPAETFWKIAGVAEQHDMKVPEFLADLAILTAKNFRALETDPIVNRWRLGMTDKEIAAELNLTNLRVSTRRQSYGLPANRRSAA